MPSVNSVNFMLRFSSIERSMTSLDNQLRSHEKDRQDKVVQSIQNTALEIKQASVTRRENLIGSIVDTFA